MELKFNLQHVLVEYQFWKVTSLLSSIVMKNQNIVSTDNYLLARQMEIGLMDYPSSWLLIADCFPTIELILLGFQV